MRTDRFLVCRPCGARLSPVARCPRCGNAKLLDLRKVRGPVKGKQSARPLSRFLDEHMRPLVWGMFASWLVLPVAGAYLHGGSAAVLGRHDELRIARLLTWLAEALLAVVVYFGAYAWDLTVGARHESLKLLGSGDGRLDVLPPPLPDAHTRRAVIRGRVAAGSTVRAPLSKAACVAFRLVGDHPRGRIDDAAAVGFTVEGDPGGPVRVELGEATVDLAAESLEGRVPEQFLRARGFPVASGLRLAEGHLAPGDEVEIEGSWQDEREGGYRDGETVRVFREEPGSPLVIRRPGGAVADRRQTEAEEGGGHARKRPESR